jgi:hypothetical protein
MQYSCKKFTKNVLQSVELKYIKYSIIKNRTNYTKITIIYEFY